MSRHEHLGDDALIEAIYGLREIGGSLHECHVCEARWSELKAKQASVSVAPEVSSGVLAAQRRAIYARMDRPERKSTRWIPAFVAAGVAVAGVLLYQPFADQPQNSALSQPVEISDAQLFADVTEVYSMEQSFEPTTATRLRVLFDERDEEGSAK